MVLRSVARVRRWNGSRAELVVLGLLLIGLSHLFYVFLSMALGACRRTSEEAAPLANFAPELQAPPAAPAAPSRPSSAAPALVEGRENATMLMLARNEELYSVLQSVRRIQDRFNNRFHYPWTFLNDVPFTADFKEQVRGMTKGSAAHFGLINETQWSVPAWVDLSQAQAAMDAYVAQGVIYGGSLSYRHMCRFNSGFFFHHPLLLKYDYYWRVEPDTHYHCDVLADPFEFMRREGKVYGFVMSMYEYAATITTLWESTRRFAAEHPEFIAADNSLAFLVDEVPPEEDGRPVRGEYNLCHFWSNFEIADLRFWRGEAYQTYFNYLDQLGGFFYEVRGWKCVHANDQRWGDAPVHSLAAALFLPRDKIHFFDSLGYEHNPYTRCPTDEESQLSGTCLCDRARSFDLDQYSCLPRWLGMDGHGSKRRI